MEKGTFPFPLAAHSSHHSHYHRFLLGADPAVLAPLPKPSCVGVLAGSLPRLTGSLDLQRWRKLFHGAIPWVDGFGPEHYDLGGAAPHRPLPLGYRRPLRRFGAFDFVQVADPSVSALALVAGDRRIIERFSMLGNDFCSELESGTQARGPGSSATRLTGRMLAGQFMEPNNRWLMPFLHIHARVLNFTSFEEAPRRLACVDHGALARAGEKAKRRWLGRQAEALADLGYRVEVHGDGPAALRVDGVSARLLATMAAPRIAVLRLLERMVFGEREPSATRFAAEMPPAVIAAMAEQLEKILTRSLWFHRPAKVGLPSEGPWRGAVRQHLGFSCPRDLALVDAAAVNAKALPFESAIFPAPSLDPAHAHTPAIEELEAGFQLPDDPELGSSRSYAPCARVTSLWLVRRFEETLREVNDRLVRAGPAHPLVALRSLLGAIDQLSEAAAPEQVKQADVFLSQELELGAKALALETERGGRAPRVPLVSLDELFETPALAPAAREPEIGGRSL